MSRGWRAFYGAIVGALFVLIAHPMSRPFILTALTHWGTSRTFAQTDLILANHAVLPVPQKLLDAGLWMDLGAERLSQRERIAQKNSTTLLDVADFAAKEDPDNAYWDQMKAVFYDALSKDPALSPNEKARYRKSAVDAWITASNLNRWDDYQSRRLRAIQQELAGEARSDSAWQFAVVYPLRLRDAGHCIELYARDLVHRLDLKTSSSLLLRYATLMNGKLLRDGARSVALGKIGAGMVEQATYPPELAGDTASIHYLVTARINFFNQLNKGFHDQAQKALDAFKSNDGWMALVEQSDLGSETPLLQGGSVLTIDLPGSLLAIALVGGVVWVLGACLIAKPALQRIFQPPYALIIGLILALMLYWTTRLPLISIALLACFGFLGFTPQNVRKNAPDQLGPVFEIVLFLLACVLAGFLCAFFIGLSTPGCQVLPELNVPHEFYGGSTLLLGLSIVVVALLLLASPAWAIVQRIPTPTVVALAFRQFGRGLFWGCMALSVISTPFCFIADRNLSGRLSEIALNEPLYYQRNFGF